MKVAEDVSVVFIVGVLWPKKGAAEGTSKVFDMELLVYEIFREERIRQTNKKERTACSDVVAAKGSPTFGTNEIEAPEVVALTQGTLLAIWAIDREEFGCYYVSTVLKASGQIARHERTDKSVRDI